MDHLDLDPSTAEGLLTGAVSADDAPPGYQAVASLFEAAVPAGGLLPGERAAVAVMAEAIHANPPAVPSRRKSVITKAKLAAAGLAGALTLTTGLAAANALPGAAQQAASDALAKVGVSVPSPNDHAGDHPNTRGKSADHTTAGTDQPSDNKGSEISNTARTTDATGVDKGAEISTEASNGKSQAGQHGGADANTAPLSTTPASGSAPVATPNSGGTSTANTASDGHSSTGASTADDHSGGAASAGSDNATSHRP